MQELQWFENSRSLGFSDIIRLEGKYRLDSLLCAVEADLQSRGGRSEAARTFLGVCALEREVHNGGFNLFFFNSSREFASDIAEALNRIGSEEIRSIARDALKCIGANSEWREDHYLDAAADASDEMNEALNELDEMYYDARQREDIDTLLWKFLTDHAAEL